jgi:hypothetical protein
MMLLYPVFKGTCVYGMNTVIGGRQQTEGRENEKTRKRENEKTRKRETRTFVGSCSLYLYIEILLKIALSTLVLTARDNKISDFVTFVSKNGITVINAPSDEA